MHGSNAMPNKRINAKVFVQNNSCVKNNMCETDCDKCNNLSM